MTGTRRTAVLRALFLTMLVSACDGGIRSFPTSPTSQTPPPPPPPAVTSVILIGTLSGVVFEVTSAGNAPVEGVRVYCDSCGAGHADSYTDGNGAYSFTDVKTSVYPLWVAKQGYDLAKPTGRAGTGWMGSINADVNGDTRFDIEIVRQ
jgi:hypothetical protein